MFRLNVNVPANKSGHFRTPPALFARLLCKLFLFLMTYQQLQILITELSTITIATTTATNERIPRPAHPGHHRSTIDLLAECRPIHARSSPLKHPYANIKHESHRQPNTTTPNETGGPSRNLILVQAEQPDFVEPIGNHTVAVGRDAQLACKISNLGNYRTAWLRVEDKGILTIHNNVITRNYRFGLMVNEDEQSFVLTIRNVQPSDKGGYMCQINSVPMKYAVGYLDVLTPPVFDEMAANATSSSAEMDDGGQADQERQQQPATNSSQVTVTEGASATLACLAQGHPKPNITWRREDGRPIVLNGLELGTDLASAPTEIKDTSSLSFVSVNRLNSGAYLCIASNGVQPSASKRQLLDVRYSPTITVPQTEISGWVNQRETQLECLVDSNPAGTHHWVKLATSTTNTDRRPMVANQEDDLWLIEHDELMPSDKFDIVIKQINSEKARMILIIRQVEKQDFSWYKCIAKNSLGLQSNFVRFYESPSGHQAATTAAPSSFSFKNIIRINDFVGGGGGNSQPQDDNRLNLPQNDDSRLSFQRSSSSSAARSDAAPSALTMLRLSSNNPVPRPAQNCQFAALFSLVMIATMLNLVATRMQTFAPGQT